MSATLLLLSLGALGLALPQASSNASVVSVPQEHTYLLPDGFEGNSNYTFVNGTHTSSDTINNVLAAAKAAPAISYDQEFLDVVGTDPEIKLIEERPEGHDFAYEMGVWVPERNSVWFTTAVSGDRVPAVMYELDLGTNKISEVQTKGNLVNPNGGYYFEGKVYIATYPNNQTYSGGVVAVDVNTLEVEMITNSYFGLRYNGKNTTLTTIVDCTDFVSSGVDDIAWASRDDNSYMYYTDLNFAFLAYENLPPLQLPAAVYRWDPQQKVVLPIISRNEINPNGVRVSPDMKTLYVTDSDATFAAAGPNSPASGPSDTFWLGPYVWAYDLNEAMMPVNRRLFAQVRQGIADGMHVDDAGNVWTGE